MVVMPSNNSGIRVGILAARHPGRLGWLIGPGGWRRPPEWIKWPVAIDNGAFPAWTKGETWEAKPFLDLLETAHRFCSPIWAIVPDVVTDAEATLASWDKWRPILAEKYPKLPLAMAVQDGMTPDMIPKTNGPSWIFIGGSDAYKMKSIPMWCAAYPGRVHVGRINGEKGLWECHNTKGGVASVDGTGFFRGDPVQTASLKNYLEQSDKGEVPQIELDL